MEARNRRLGWIAIGVGVLALIFALGGLGRAARFGDYNRFGYENHGHGRGWAQQGEFGSRGDFVPGEQRGHGEFGRGHHGGPRGPGFLFPLFLLNSLFKLIGLAALVFLVLRLLGNGRQGGHPGQGGNPQAPQPPPHPESYTGETTSL